MQWRSKLIEEDKPIEDINEQDEFFTFSDTRLLGALKKTEARLLIFDPLSAYVGEKTQPDSANSVRAQFRPLLEMAKKLR